MCCKGHVLGDKLGTDLEPAQKDLNEDTHINVVGIDIIRVWVSIQHQ
jgi:hypothetical protein